MSELQNAHEVYQWNQTAAYNLETLAKAADMLSGIMFQYYGFAKIGVICWLGVLSEVSTWEPGFDSHRQTDYRIGQQFGELRLETDSACVYGFRRWLRVLRRAWVG